MDPTFQGDIEAHMKMHWATETFSGPRLPYSYKRPSDILPIGVDKVQKWNEFVEDEASGNVNKLP